MNIVPNATSYATRENAVRKLRKVLGENFEKTRWVIIAQEDGRFTPAVLSDGQNSHLCHHGLAVIG